MHMINGIILNRVTLDTLKLQYEVVSLNCLWWHLKTQNGPLRPFRFNANYSTGIPVNTAVGSEKAKPRPARGSSRRRRSGIRTWNKIQSIEKTWLILYPFPQEEKVYILWLELKRTFKCQHSLLLQGYVSNQSEIGYMQKWRLAWY